MRFVYGFVLGVLVSVISAILYLALAGGGYLLVLSPEYQEMRTKLAPCEKVEQQRDQLTERLGDLERRFAEITERFGGLSAGAPAALAEPPPLVEATPALEPPTP